MKQQNAPKPAAYVQQTVEINEPPPDEEYFFAQIMPDTQTFSNFNAAATTSISQKAEEFSKIGAIIVILAIAAIYKSKGCDVAGACVREECLKPAVNGLFIQIAILTALSASVIFSLHNLNIIKNWQETMLATHVCILVIGYQIWSGYCQISHAAKQIAIWRKYEENVINYDYLKLKKQQYEKQYYQLFLSQTQEIPMDLIEEVQYLTMRL